MKIEFSKIRLIAAIIFICMAIFQFRVDETHAAVYELKPRIEVSEEYTDNILESATNKKEEYITRVMPGFHLKCFTPRLDLDTSYNFDYRHYAKKTNDDEYTHNILSNATLSVIENLFYIQAGDTYKRVSLNVARDNTNESLYLNQTDQNIGTVSPYFIWRLGNNSSIKTGYRYTNTWYKEPAGVDKREHYAFADASHELLEKFSLTWGYSYSNTATSVQKYQRHNAYGGFRYEYGDKSFIFGQIGNTWQLIDTGTHVSNLFWNAGLTHEFPIVTVTLETKVQYSEDPLRSSIKETVYSGKLARAFQRGSLELSAAYSEFEIIETGVIDNKKTTIAAAGKYEILDDITLNLSGVGEKFSNVQTNADYPYRLSGNANLYYSINRDVVLGINYTHVSNRYSLNDVSNSRDTNRTILEVKINF